MAFQPGDKVSVLDDAINGTVLRVTGDRVTLLTNDGFELVVTEAELVLIQDESLLKVSNIEAHRALKDKQFVERKKPRSVKRDKVVPPMEVDLHIEKLVSNHRRMDPGEIRDFQLNTARYKLEFAIQNRIQRVVFIHGVGEGVLKKELEYLFGRYEGVHFYDADYAQYGLGATEVYIPQGTTLY